jgi:anti-sigma regulatory factor (Ser/Thr protein kinase)
MVNASDLSTPTESDLRMTTSFTLSLRELTDLSTMRAIIRGHLRAAEVPPERVADAVLVASELATNAKGAAEPGTAIQVAGRVGGGRIVLDVSNHPRHNHERTDLLTPVRMPGADAERGRGLATVAALSWRVSADIESHHTTMHAELTI